jgi:hypothetical protein
VPRDGQLDCWNTSLELFCGVKISKLTLHLNVAIVAFFNIIFKINIIYIYSICLTTNTKKRICDH